MQLTRNVIFFVASLLAAPSFAQQSLLQAGPNTAGHLPMYSGQGYSQPIVIDGGGAAGGGLGSTLSEFGVTSRSPTNIYPSTNSGNGPNGEHGCFYDGPTTNPTGYHYLCIDPNAAGGGLLSYGTGGAASQLPFSFISNGIKYSFPFVIGGIVGPSTTTVNDIALWNSATGTALKAITPGSGVTAALQINVGSSGSFLVNGGVATFSGLTVNPTSGQIVLGNSSFTTYAKGSQFGSTSAYVATYTGRPNESLATIDSKSQIGGFGILSASNTAPNAVVGAESSIGAGSYVFNDNTTQIQYAYGRYVESWRLSGAGTTLADEVDSINFGSTTTLTDGNWSSSVGTAGGGITAGYWAACGGGYSGVNPCTSAVTVLANGSTWQTGIFFAPGSLTNTSSQYVAIDMPTGYKILWENSGGAMVSQIRSDATNLSMAQLFYNGGISWQDVATFTNEMTLSPSGYLSTAGGVSFSGIVTQTYVTDPALTASAYGATLKYNANYTGLSVVSAIFPGYTGYDGLTVVADLPPGSTIYQSNGVGAYVRARANNITSGQVGGLGVGYFGACTAEGQGSVCWASNYSLGDDYSPGTYSGSTTARELVGFEPDFYVYHSDTQVIGVQLAPANSSTKNPVSGYGFIVSPGPNGAGFWSDGFVSQDGAALVALNVGAVSASASAISQYVSFVYRTGSADKATNVWADTNGNINFDNGGLIIPTQTGTSAYSRYLTFTSTNASSPVLSYLNTSNSGQFVFTNGINVASNYLITTSVSLYNGSGSGSGTLTNAPLNGNPTKWIQINDNGSLRYIPAW